MGRRKRLAGFEDFSNRWHFRAWWWQHYNETRGVRRKRGRTFQIDMDQLHSLDCVDAIHMRRYLYSTGRLGDEDAWRVTREPTHRQLDYVQVPNSLIVGYALEERYYNPETPEEGTFEKSFKRKKVRLRGKPLNRKYLHGPVPCGFCSEHGHYRKTCPTLSFLSAILDGLPIRKEKHGLELQETPPRQTPKRRTMLVQSPPASLREYLERRVGHTPAEAGAAHGPGTGGGGDRHEMIPFTVAWFKSLHVGGDTDT